PRTLEAHFLGRPRTGVAAKDLILALIGQIGTAGATGHVIEYTGEAIRALSMEERMTVCNMSIEAGARAGLIAPDATTFAYLAGRRFSPSDNLESSGAPSLTASSSRVGSTELTLWDEAVQHWSEFVTDTGAIFDRELTIAA